MSERYTIKELKRLATGEPARGETHVQVEDARTKVTRSGGEYLELKLADAEDEFILRVWSDAPAMEEARRLRAGDFIALAGEWANGAYGLEPRRWSMRPLSEEERRALLGGPAELREKQAADFAFITEQVDALRDPRLRALGRLFLNEFGERFRRAGAAREYHHARRGGLVEHTAQMMRSALALWSVYPQTNRDLLVAGVLFHDSGKLWENCYERDGFSMPWSEHGELLGHISLGIELVNRLWRRLLESDEAASWAGLEPASEDVRLHLLHLVAAHHGEYQFGSPALPRTPEAILLHHIDNIDAKLEMMKDCYESSAQLAPNVFEKKRPLPVNLVRPLPPCAPAE